MARWSINRTIARTLLSALFTGGFTANSALSFLKEHGIGYRRQDFLADWREVTGVQKMEKVFRFIPRKYKPSESLFTPSVLGLKNKYTYILEAVGRNVVTGEEVKHTFWFGSSTRPSIQIVIEKFWEKYSEMLEERYGIVLEMERVQVVGGLKRAA